MEPTKKNRLMPVVVLIAGSRELLQSCQKCAALATAARVESCSLDQAATKVATWRPFAIVVPESVFEFDPKEFKALARDVQATLVTVPDPLPETRARAALVPALRDAARRWREAQA
jgi:hypothetical protein